MALQSASHFAAGVSSEWSARVADAGRARIRLRALLDRCLGRRATLVKPHGKWVDTGQVDERQRRSLKRLALLFAVIPVAYLVGVATESVHAFDITAAVGIVVVFCLRFTRFG
jgi:hypothetical protein